jgi:hypothetical protein
VLIWGRVNKLLEVKSVNFEKNEGQMKSSSYNYVKHYAGFNECHIKFHCSVETPNYNSVESGVKHYS